MNTPPDALLMLSGGVDSTYCLWDRVERGLSTRVHHVLFTDVNGRQELEAKAVANILAWLNDHGGRGLIEYTESRYDMGDLVPLGLWNGHIIAHWIGVILFGEPDIQDVIIGVQADDIRFAPPVVRENRDMAYKSGALAVAGRTPRRLVYPARNLTKADIVALMPPDLLELCWWCHDPGFSDNDGEACHRCHTCRLMDAALRGVRT